MTFQTLFARTEPLLAPSLLGRVKNLFVTPKWLGDDGQLWLRLQDATGVHCHIVDAASGVMRLAFDHAGVARALEEAGAGKFHPDLLPIADLGIDGGQLRLTLGGATYRCSADGSVCTRLDDGGIGSWVSPDGRTTAFVRGHDLWLRGHEGSERQLTRDGIETHAYGVAAPFEYDLVPRRRAGISTPPEGVRWSPDGTFLVAFRIDRSDVPERCHVMEFTAPDEPYARATTQRLELTGEPGASRRTITVIDLATETVRRAQLDNGWLQDWAWFSAYRGKSLWWDAEGKSLFLPIANSRGNRYGIAAIELGTGDARILIEEACDDQPYPFSGSIFSEAPAFQVLSSGAELIWYSPRNGHSHLYLFDVLTGTLKRQLTDGVWTVYALVHVDEKRRQVYFTATGKENGRNPYYRHLYRVGLDGGEPELLTPDDADHEFSSGIMMPSAASVSPCGRYLVDVHSTVAQPPVAVLRKTDGSLLAELYRADASSLFDDPMWQAPQTFEASAADGATPLYGVMYKPYDFDPAKTYPVLDLTYPGPQGKFTPTSFFEGLLPMMWHGQAAANLGMIVLAFDARGCGGRSRTFSAAHFATEDALGAADHEAAIRNLAGSHAYMDIGRVGTVGASMGGYAALRAQLLGSGLFKICASLFAVSDWRKWGGGSMFDRSFRVSDDWDVAHEYLKLVSNVSLASRLEGKLLLVYGEIDEIVPLHNAFSIFKALQDADKDYESILLAEQGHSGTLSTYCARATLKFLYDNLVRSELEPVLPRT